MVASRLIHLIESHSREVANAVASRICGSRQATGLQTIPKGEIYTKTQDLLDHLGEWLLTKSDEDIRRRYFDSGVARANQGVALADLCRSIVLTKQYLWEYLQNQAFARNAAEIYGEMELLRLLGQFFDRALCYTVEGYESTLPEPAPKMSRKKQHKIEGIGWSI